MNVSQFISLLFCFSLYSCKQLAIIFFVCLWQENKKKTWKTQNEIKVILLSKGLSLPDSLKKHFLCHSKPHISLTIIFNLSLCERTNSWWCSSVVFLQSLFHSGFVIPRSSHFSTLNIVCALTFLDIILNWTALKERREVSDVKCLLNSQQYTTTTTTTVTTK